MQNRSPSRLWLQPNHPRCIRGCTVVSEAPSDLRDVADRYGELFARIDDKWKQLQATQQERWFEEDHLWAAKAKPMLDVLYGVTAPCEVPTKR